MVSSGGSVLYCGGGVGRVEEGLERGGQLARQVALAVGDVAVHAHAVLALLVLAGGLGVPPDEGGVVDAGEVGARGVPEQAVVAVAAVRGSRLSARRRVREQTCGERLRRELRAGQLDAGVELEQVRVEGAGGLERRGHLAVVPAVGPVRVRTPTASVRTGSVDTPNVCAHCFWS